MPKAKFGSKKAANKVRDEVAQHVSPSDDRRQKTVQLKASTPDSIVERVREKALGSRKQQAKGAGKAKLSKGEQDSLKKQHGTFSWRQHGFEAMSAKAALQSEGVNEWMDYYEPGEGVDSAMRKVRSKKGQAGQRGGPGIGMQGMRSDVEESGNMGRRARQTERMAGQRTKSAKAPAIVEGDTEAMEFLQEETDMGNDPFDVRYEYGEYGEPVAEGQDVQLAEERHAKRSERAQHLDEIQAAPTAPSIMAWAANPAQYDFPGVDSVDPQAKHAARPEHAQEVDENELAPIADNAYEWAKTPDQYDLPGVDTPPAYGLGPNEDKPEGLANVDRDTKDLPDPKEVTRGNYTSGTPIAPKDLETEAEKPGKDIMGRRPSHQKLTHDEMEGLASGEAADMAFVEAEADRAMEEAGLEGSKGGVNVDMSGSNEVKNTAMKDTRALQDTLGFAADATENRESRVDTETNTGGIMADEREQVTRGADRNETDVGEQASLGSGNAGMDAMDELSKLDQDLHDL